MAKRNLKVEKRLRNEVFAKLHQKDKKEKKRSPWLNWCRTAGHPASCSCNLPSKEEVIRASVKKK